MADEIRAYGTVRAHDLVILTHEMNVAIAEGWRPHGGIAVSGVQDTDDLRDTEGGRFIRYLYVQAMVK